MAEAEFLGTVPEGRELLIGCGNNRKKQLAMPGEDEWVDVVTLDMDPDCKPDIEWDLHHMPLPFEDESFKEIHAYDVLEHVGTQGDWKLFFKQFEEFWRILEPEGRMFCICPCWDSEWAWGDPGHTRVITQGTVAFLDQNTYEQVGETAMTDYRHWYKADFEIEGIQETNGRFCFVLKKRT